MKQVMACCVDTDDNGVVARPKGKWKGHPKKDTFSEIVNILGSDYAKDRETQKSVT